MKRTLSFLISLVVGGMLLFLALRGIPMDDLAGSLRGARYGWLVPLFLAIVLSHLLRAYRWKVLIEALPAARSASSPHVIRLRNAFSSVLIGYLVNLATPRLGEVARSANLARQEQKSLSGVLGTVVVERLLDSLVLLIAILVTLALYVDRFSFVEDHMLAPLRHWIEAVPAATLAGVGVAGLLLVAGGVLGLRTLKTSTHPRAMRLRQIAATFRDGMATLHRSHRRWTILWTTVLMWFGYVWMAYLPFLMLGLNIPYGLSLLDAFAVMVFGSLGVAVPAPGGTGSYHYITRLTLENGFGIPGPEAVAYAVLSHGAQVVLILVLGTAAILARGMTWSAQNTSEVESPTRMQ